MGAIDIGGLPRFGPQLSADLVLGQDVFSGQFDVTHARGHHLLKAGGLVEHYSAAEFNPTFSRGVYRFASLQTFLAGTAASFIGLTPEGDVNRAWDWTLAGGYIQDDWAARRDLTINAGLRLEAAPRAGRSARRQHARSARRRRRRSGHSTRIPARRSRRGSARRGVSAAAIAPPCEAATASTTRSTTSRT